MHEWQRLFGDLESVDEGRQGVGVEERRERTAHKVHLDKGINRRDSRVTHSAGWHALLDPVCALDRRRAQRRAQRWSTKKGEGRGDTPGGMN